jgi:hypothetical protein
MAQPHHETNEVDSSGNPVDVRPVEEPPRRDEPEGPLEDDYAKSQPGHPRSNENFRGD